MEILKNKTRGEYKLEHLTYEYSATKKLKKRAHVGVVGSGNLEVIIEPRDDDKISIEVRTGISGFNQTWNELIERFFQENDYAATIYINDFGATPGVVQIRLYQAIEVSNDD